MKSNMKVCKCKSSGNSTLKNTALTVPCRGKPFSFCKETLVCNSCGLPICSEEIFKGWQDYANKLFIQENREMSPERIQEIRERIGLSRPEFADYLCICPRTVLGWEKEGYPLNRAMEELIRIKCSDEYMKNAQEEIFQVKRKRKHAAVA